MVAEASATVLHINDAVDLTSTILNPSAGSPTYAWQMDLGGWFTTRNAATFSYLSGQAETLNFRVTVSYPGGEQAVSNTVTVQWVVPPPTPTPAPTATPAPTPQALDVAFSGEAFGERHLLLTQGGGPTLGIDLTVKPGNTHVLNTGGSHTTVWPPVARIRVWATVIAEIDCDDVRGITGGCATLPRIGHRLHLADITPATAGDPCVAPADITASIDAAADLLAVTADGSGGGPGVWEIEAEVETAAVPAGSCTPTTVQAVAAGSEDQTAPDDTIISLRLADIVAYR